MNKITLLFSVGLLACGALPSVRAQVPHQFNYQGKLLSGTNLVNASTTMVFRLYNADAGGAAQYVETQTVTVVDGLYSTHVGKSPGFGLLAAAATNEPLFLEVQIGDTILTPREQVVSVMYAIRAAGVTTGGITTAMLANNAVTGPKIAGGSVSNVHVTAASITSNKIDWTQMPAGLRDGDDNTILKSYAENGTFSPSPTASGTDSIAQGKDNVAAGDYSVVGGGENNSALSVYAAIGGGDNNSIGARAGRSTISGGSANTVGSNSIYGTIGGGAGNSLRVNADGSTIGGGTENTIGTNAFWSTIPGGSACSVGNGSSYALAAGRRARANHAGTFIWADSRDDDFASTTSNQFLIRAEGGVGIGTNVTRERLTVAGNVLVDGSLTATNLSSLAYRVGEAFVIVQTGTNDGLNATNLLAAYYKATTLTPHGQARSAGNRVAVLVPPGRYNLGAYPLTIDAEHVDLIGLASACEDQYIRGNTAGPGCGVLQQTADDVRLENLFVECTWSTGGSTTSNAPAAYFPNPRLSNTVVRNCRFKAVGTTASHSMRLGVSYDGTYEDCVAGDYAFGGPSGDANGRFIRCRGGDGSFGGLYADATGYFQECEAGFGSFAKQGLASGTFIDCTGGNSSFGADPTGDAAGTFIRCRGGAFCFGSGGKASGTFRECVADMESFGGDRGEASGLFINCQGENGCFGSSQGTEASGTFINCIAGTGSFGFEGDASGTFVNCVGGIKSFGGRGTVQGEVSGTFFNCRMEGGTWGGQLSGRMEGCRWEADVRVLDGARIYNTTIPGSIIGVGSGACKIAHVRCTGILLGTVTNQIGVHYNVVDSNVD